MKEPKFKKGDVVRVTVGLGKGDKGIVQDVAVCDPNNVESGFSCLVHRLNGPRDGSWFREGSLELLHREDAPVPPPNVLPVESLLPGQTLIHSTAAMGSEEGGGVLGRHPFAGTGQPRGLHVYNCQVHHPKAAPGTKGLPHFVYVVAPSFEEALAAVRAALPEAEVKTVSQNSGPNNPLVSIHGQAKLVVAQPKKEGGA